MGKGGGRWYCLYRHFLGWLNIIAFIDHQKRPVDMASGGDRRAQGGKRGSGSALEGSGPVPSVSRDKRSGLVVPDGYSPPSHSPSSRRHGARSDGHSRQGEPLGEGLAAPRALVSE